jgi:adenylate kinase family enzyme
MTTIINLWGGPGSGKSTTAAELFALLKKRGVNCELVQEYIKGWVWEERKRIIGDQLYVLAKQVRREQILLGKVDVIITDSPVWFSAFYDLYYFKKRILAPVIQDYQKSLKEDGHIVHDIFISRMNRPFNKAGRYETEDQAIDIDRSQMVFAGMHNIKMKFKPDNKESVLDWSLETCGLH